MNSTYLIQVVDFLTSIGLEVRRVAEADGFIEDVRITEGRLEITDHCSPTNLLHEAGHLAVVPARFRHLMSDDIDFGTREMLDIIKAEGHGPDSFEWRSVAQASEMEAVCWQWAAGQAIGLPEELIILDEDYEGIGREVRAQLITKTHPGIKGLAHADFCKPRADLPWPGKPYPELNYWLQR
ncbi:hypothetical protein HNP46_000382 [Pseudomonas nitritireducens]|uniref:Uncharacterized protein n=1 Tax=Pseudomonas nitroreducens TaxID=46680 RepID=A0A7W7KFM6_PSENT|nr:hypothetical protein [Pseudomonas nitritireducens]MBB4861571.1 hypothetical protein [Pseudomonas nitritireducens]